MITGSNQGRRCQCSRKCSSDFHKVQKNVGLVLDLNQDREYVIFSENYRNCVFALPLQKQRASQAIFVLAFHAGTETSPRTLYLHASTFMRQQCAVSETRTSYLSQS